jgi:hypothetical protein
MKERDSEGKSGKEREREDERERERERERVRRTLHFFRLGKFVESSADERSTGTRMKFRLLLKIFCVHISHARHCNNSHVGPTLLKNRFLLSP